MLSPRYASVALYSQLFVAVIPMKNNPLITLDFRNISIYRRKMKINPFTVHWVLIHEEKLS